MVEVAKTMQAQIKRRRMILQLVIAMVIFLSGMIVGAGGTMQFVKHRDWRPPPPRDGERRRYDPNAIVEKWVVEYELSEQQAEQVKAVWARANQMRRDVFRESHVKFEQAMEAMVNGMREVMTPEQFEIWYAEYQKRMKHRGGGSRDWGRGRRGPGGGGRRGRDPNRPPGPPGPPRLPEPKPSIE